MKSTTTAVYDADSNDVEDENVDRVTEPHTAKPTINGTVITMTEWLTRWEVYQATPDPTDEDKAQVMGDFWVWDDDGWAYWANAIQPDTATGLLLDGIELVNPPSDNYYYGVNVVGQFVTADDIGFLNGTGFYDTSNGKDTIPSENAEALIELLTGTKIDITRVEITGPDSIDRGKFADYTATVLKGGNAVEDAEVTWSLIGGKHSDTEVYSTGRVNVQSFEEANELTLVASYTGANGETVTGSKKIEVTTPPANVSFSAPSATSPTVYQYGSLTLEASVKLNNRDVTGAKVTWSIADKTSADTKVESTGDLTGTLTVGKDEPVGNKITVTVSYYDPNVKQTLTASKAITVQEAWQTQVENATAFVDSGSASNTVTIDGIKWKVLVKDDEKQQALIWAAEPVDSIWFDKIDGATETNDDYTSVWRDASIRTWLQNWLESETEALKAAAVETTISTRDSSLEYGALNTADRGMEVSNQWIETQDKVFLLSEADLFGTYQGDADLVDPRDYTYNGMQLTTKITQRRFDWTSYGWAWLRNASSYSNMQNPHRNWYLAGVYYTGYSTTDPDNHISGSELSLYVDNQYGNVLPALWVDYSMD